MEDLTLAANGTGHIVIGGVNLIVDNITAKTTNGNLSILSNGTGIPQIGNGLKFSNETLSFYQIGTFSISFLAGTFNSGSVTAQFERIGNRVIIRFPSNWNS